MLGKTPIEESLTLGPEAEPLLAAPDAPPALATPDVGHAGPDVAPSCARCGAQVPEGMGRCPQCGVFQKANVESVVHGLRSKRLAKIVDQYRVDLIEQLFAERGGRDALDVVSRIAIENYALVCAQHKTIEARLDQDGLFTQTGRRRSAFDMLKGISETIDRLRAELPPTLKAQAGPAPIISEVRRSIVHTNADGRVIDAGLPVQTSTGPTLAPESTRTSESTCRYGCGTLARCAEIKATRPEDWETLHGLDPEVIARRDKEATEIMRKQITHWYR